MHIKKAIFSFAALLMAGSAVAGPAAWYQWRSKLEPSFLCSQTSPGEGWEKLSGPFSDARCEKRIAIVK
ncbi:hypothetical protein BH11PSE12_BH11PSE12_01310 [soil metagenome]